MADAGALLGVHASTGQAGAWSACFCGWGSDTVTHLEHVVEVALLEGRTAGRRELADELVASVVPRWRALDMGVGRYPEDSAHRSAHEDRAEACADELEEAVRGG